MLKEVDGAGKLSVEITGNGYPAVRSDPIRHAAEMYAVTGRDAQIAGESRFANPTTTWLEARSVLRIRKFKIRPLDAWDVWICKHNVNGKVVTRTPQQESKHRPDYTHERKLRLQKLCIARRSHQWHAASVHILCHLCLTYCCCCRLSAVCELTCLCCDRTFAVYKLMLTSHPH